MIRVPTMSVTLALLLFTGCGSGPKPDKVEIVNYRNVPIFVSHCLSEADEEGKICSGWARLERDDKFVKETEPGVKVFVRILDQGRSVQLTGSVETRSFLNADKVFRVEETEETGMVRLVDDRFLLLFDKNVYNYVEGRDLPQNWSYQDYYRSMSGRTEVKFFPD